jgi:hypothetical protein
MTTIPQNLVTSRTTIAITTEAIERLKAISKDTGVKLYEAMDAMIELCKDDIAFRERMIVIAKAKKQAKQDGKTQSLTTRAKKLPKPLRDKLRAMTDEQLAELIEKAGF